MAELQTRKGPKSFLAELSLKFLLVIVLFILTLVFFALITYEVIFDKEELFDKKIIAYLSSHTTENFTQWMKFVTVFGSSKFLIPVYGLLMGYQFYRRNLKLGLNVGLIPISGTALSHGLKRLFERARPDLPLLQSLKTYSFPSGHALSSIILCSILVYLLWRSNIHWVWKWMFSSLLFVLTMAIGISRIVLRMHYPTDVLAGFCLGLAWVILSFYLLGFIKQKHRQTVKLPY